MRKRLIILTLFLAASAAGCSPTPKPVDSNTRAADGMVMVYVPAGEFDMGSTDEETAYALSVCTAFIDCGPTLYTREQPVHTVTLDAFWLDQTEVTNAQYALCVEAGACQPPDHTIAANQEEYYGLEEFADYPVVFVTWFHAETYCEWAGARLPTEAEWEYAARGPERRIFPWGDEYDGELVNACDVDCRARYADLETDDGYNGTSPVGAFQKGASWVAAYDMAGNVWEWLADWYGDYPAEPQRNPTGPESGMGRVIRSGAFGAGPDNLRGATRDFGLPDRSGYGVGFRCASSTAPQP